MFKKCLCGAAHERGEEIKDNYWKQKRKEQNQQKGKEKKEWEFINNRVGLEGLIETLINSVIVFWGDSES